VTVRALVRSLDAEVTAALGAAEVADRVQRAPARDGTDAHGFLVRAPAPTGGGAAAALEAAARVVHRRSPAHAGVDVALRAAAGRVQAGADLDTLAAVQGFLVDALEPALSAFRDEAAAALGAAAAEAAGELEARVRGELERQLVGPAARAAHPFSLRFDGAMEGADAALFAQRGGEAFAIVRVEVRGCEMSNEETRRGRIDVRGRVREAAVWDGTPSAGAHPLVAGKADSAAGGDLVSFAYTHYGRGEAPPPPAAAAGAGVQAALEVRVAALRAVCCPRLVTEVAAHVAESSVFSANLLAIRSAASSAASFRRRLDPRLLAHGYRMALDLAGGGAEVLLPVSSVARDGFMLRLGPVAVSNRFEPAAGAAVEVVSARLEGIRLAARRQDATAGGGGDAAAERDLITFAAECEARRRMGPLAGGSPEDPLLRLSVRVGAVAVTVAQAELTLAWRAVFGGVAEVRVALNSIGSGKARRRQERSILDLAAVQAALRGSLQRAALADKAQQEMLAPAGAVQLDLEAAVSLDALRVTVEAGGGPGEPARPHVLLELAGLCALAQVWAPSERERERERPRKRPRDRGRKRGSERDTLGRAGAHPPSSCPPRLPPH
jgi:hypothetical protein